LARPPIAVVLKQRRVATVVNPTRIPSNGFLDGLDEGGWYDGARVKRDVSERESRPMAVIRTK
jgi:hypothetical protein